MPKTRIPLTPGLRILIFLARDCAARAGLDRIHPEHLLMGLYRLSQGLAITILRKQGIELEKTYQALEKTSNGPKLGRKKLFRYKRHTTKESRVIIETAAKAASKLGHGWIGTEHLLLALIEHKDALPFDWTKDYELKHDEIERQVLEEIEDLEKEHYQAIAPPFTLFKKLYYALQRRRSQYRRIILLLGIPRKIPIEVMPVDTNPNPGQND